MIEKIQLDYFMFGILTAYICYILGWLLKMCFDDYIEDKIRNYKK